MRLIGAMLVLVSACGIDQTGIGSGSGQPDVGIDSNVDAQLDASDTSDAAECTSGATESCGDGVGACDLGRRTCRNGMWSECEDVVGPSTEICGNSIDEDCNGELDNGCECTSGDTEDCTGSDGCMGMRSCEGGMFGDCVVSETPQTFYRDADGDTWGSQDPADTMEFCGEPGAGWVNRSGDCNDGDGGVNPNGMDDCSTDRNCDGALEPNAFFVGPDGHRYLNCGTPRRNMVDLVNPTASDYCAQFSGYQILELNSAAEQTFVENHYPSPYWLNVFAMGLPLVFEWRSPSRPVLDGSSYGGTEGAAPWRRGEPNNPLTEGCVRVNNSVWESSFCGTLDPIEHVICEAPP